MEERKVVDYKSDENKKLFEGIASMASSMMLAEDEANFSGLKANMYTKSAFKAVVKYVNNDYVNVLDEYAEEIIQIALFNYRKDKATNINIKRDREISSVTQGPVSVSYSTKDSYSEYTISSDIPTSIKSSLKRYLRGY